MSTILNILNFFPDRADPRTMNLFLMSSPWPTIAIIVLYVKFVTDWGPKWMKNKPPFQIDGIVQTYDLLQILFNLYGFYKALTMGWLNYYSWKCQPVDYSMDPRAVETVRLCHLYFLLKISDLLDTVFFVLRKKQNQVTFLHVYHHASMVLAIWYGTRFYAGGHGTFLGLANTLVHAVMYGHYFVMSLKIWKPWWKKHITQLQLLQFFVGFYHNVQLWFVEDCGYPKWISLLWIPQNITFLWMFGKFYYHAYVKVPKEAADDIVDKKNLD